MKNKKMEIRKALISASKKSWSVPQLISLDIKNTSSGVFYAPIEGGKYQLSPLYELS